jgi:hypothetical protein
MKRPSTFYAATFLFASVLAGADVIAASDVFFPEQPEMRGFGALVMLAGVSYLAIAIVIGEER